MPEPIEVSSGATDPTAPGLSQIERVIDTYVAPSKTFQDIRRNTSWWLPFLLGVVIAYIFVFAIQHEIGWQKVAEITAQNNASLQQRISSMTPAQVQQMYSGIAAFTKGALYASPVFVMVFALIGAGILMVSFNFGLGAKASYQQYLAVWFYASLPFLIKFILAAIAIFAGASAEQFDMQNPVGTNIGWYLSSDLPLWVRTLFSSFDVFTIWVVVLLVIGCATVARVKRSSAAIIVVGWWLLTIFAGTIMAAFQG